MPSYRTHSIHGELILPEIDKKIEINNEMLKSFCMGPDAMILTDYNTFHYQHENNTKAFFFTMINKIKDKKLSENSEVMAFLYGQLNHFILDLVMHPLIYYMTEGIEKKYKIQPHGLVELWIDDYTAQKYNKNQIAYYHKMFIKDRKLMKLIDEIYNEVYGVNNESIKYSFGMFAKVTFDVLSRRNLMGIAPLIIKLFNIGDFTYKQNFDRALPYLNLNNDIWYNPETKEEYKSSFDDLWNKSIEIALETINDVNAYLYNGKELKNSFILNNISWNTGISCEKGQSLKYIKKYK